ncbi:hypothetical protein PR003_g21710 [Phytophthora rubi]|uniref:Uncharacterized protein n=1 Tax=Phytophthora rubi TaxID=129364 RepID=A0A6A3GED0_9STRA|nr:hypothetical protein PR001_g31607 [Phytophthora rubi]KAE8989932.1 hypothetical protein PR002_g21296 [Phytophthora rubi]KAE9304621.1 hypothetical protein PR003_g21710 [Phytophthora rubi]
MDTEKFAEYLTYVKMFDDAAVAKWRLSGKAPLAHPEPTAAELTARAIALAINKREDEYAKLALGLDALSGNALKEHTNYRFYEYFKEAL